MTSISPATRVTDQAAVVLGEDLRGDGEVRVAVELELLPRIAADGSVAVGPADCPSWTMRAPGDGSRDRPFERLAAERIEDVGRLTEVTVETDGLVRAEVKRPLETGGIPSRRHDVGGAEQLRRLDCDLPRRSGRSEHEHPVALAHRRTPRKRHPAREPGNPERTRERGVGTLG